MVTCMVQLLWAHQSHARGGSQSHLTQKLVIYAKDTARKWVEKASTAGLMAASADSQFTVLCREKRNGTRCGKEA